MKIKKILSVFLTAALIGSSSVMAVSAKTSAPDNSYNYVALGDSIAAGYGLKTDDPNKALDPVLILSQDLIDNPVKEAYAAVFGEHLKELATFVASKLSPLEMVTGTATSFVLKRYKEEGVVFENEETDHRLVISP